MKLKYVICYSIAFFITVSFSCRSNPKKYSTNSSTLEDKSFQKKISNDTLRDSKELVLIDTTIGIEAVKNYLLQFGYLDIGDKSRSVISSIALKKFQKFFGIPQTGRPDKITIQTMLKPRCGIADGTRGPGGSYKWNQISLYYSLADEGTIIGNLNYDQVLNALKEAFKIWDNSTFFNFTYTAGDHGDDGFSIFPLLFSNISIRGKLGDHNDGYPFDGPFNGITKNTLAHAFFPTGNGFGLPGDIHFDASEAWSVDSPTPANKIDLVTIAAHEIGHSLGLNHSDVPGSLMNPIYEGSHRYLSSDDIDRFNQLYN